MSGAESFEASGDGQRIAVGRWKMTSSAAPELLVVQLRTAPPEDSFELVFTDRRDREGARRGGRRPTPCGRSTRSGQWIRSSNDAEFYSDKGTLEVKESDASHLRGTFDVSGKCGRRREACRIEGEFDLRREKPTSARPS